MLSFTSEVYLSLLGDYSRATWPMPYVAAALGLAAIALAARPIAHASRIVAGILAAIWLWTGIVFHYLYFAGINFVAPLFALLFVLQGLLLLWTGTVRGRLGFGGAPGLRRWSGLAIAAVGIGLQLLGGAPAPTVILTLGVLLWATRVPWHLLVIPLLWCLIGAAYAWALGIYEDFSLLAAAALTLVLRGADRKIHHRRTEDTEVHRET